MTDSPRRAPINDAAVVWSVPTDEVAARLQTSPLVIIMHGYGSHENDLISLAPLLPAGTIAASLRAPLLAPHPVENGFAWFTIGEPGNPRVSGLDDAAASVLDWLDRVEAHFGTPASIATLGFSQGGAMAIHLLRTAPERFVAAVNLSGFVVNGQVHGDRVMSESRPPVFWGRDVADPIVNGVAVERTEAWLPEHSTLTAKLYPGIRHGVSQEEITDVSEFLSAVQTTANPLVTSDAELHADGATAL
ncbi:alpha/beta hydrolase [Subtercola frigoramans]|uniref:Phospholipase/carboxylesterase n=1 Tax=Subtercola frigoramans TaxID=120298 RepID=A0ABS2L485_9MICO|nr:alpha/beta fold hydrolase [Subtercola frigoramans]MBM7471271.1 phospholipase/carboxylesterase [Subtercola frigoramans]